MSLLAKLTYIVPAQTARAARAVFSMGNSSTRMYDDLQRVVEGCDFADLFLARGGPLRRPSGSRLCRGSSGPLTRLPRHDPHPWCSRPHVTKLDRVGDMSTRGVEQPLEPTANFAAQGKTGR
jgi:hypothetical protein